MVILAAVSGARHQDRVVETGYDLASAYGEELVVLHVMGQDQFDELSETGTDADDVVMSAVADVGGIEYFPEGRGVSNYNLEVAMEDATRVAEQCVESTLSSEQRRDVDVSGLVGDPETEILQEADRIDARYIVVGGRKRSPAGKAIFGSVSQSVILGSERPVVAVLQAED